MAIIIPQMTAVYLTWLDITYFFESRVDTLVTDDIVDSWLVSSTQLTDWQVVMGVEGALELELLVLLDNVFLTLIGLNPALSGLSDSVGVSFPGLGVEGLFDSCNDAYNAFLSSRSSFQDNPAVISLFYKGKENR